MHCINFLCLIFLCTRKSQVKDYYYYKGEKKNLNISKTKLVVYFEEDIFVQVDVGETLKFVKE